MNPDPQQNNNSNSNMNSNPEIQNTFPENLDPLVGQAKLDINIEPNQTVVNQAFQYYNDGLVPNTNQIPAQPFIDNYTQSNFQPNSDNANTSNIPKPIPTDNLFSVPNATPPIISDLIQPQQNAADFHDYINDNVSSEAELQLNSLYQKNTNFSPIAEPDYLSIDQNNLPQNQTPPPVYQSVTYPEANFQSYKSLNQVSGVTNINNSNQISDFNNYTTPDSSNLNPDNQVNNYNQNLNLEVNNLVQPITDFKNEADQPITNDNSFSNFTTLNAEQVPIDQSVLNTFQNFDSSQPVEQNLENGLESPSVFGNVQEPLPIGNQFESPDILPVPIFNRRFLIIAGIALLLLVGLVATLGFLAWRQGQNVDKSGNISLNSSSTYTNSENNSNNSSSSVSSSSSRSIAITFNDPNGPKPSDVAKKTSETAVNDDFIKKYFADSYKEGTGCTNQDVCGVQVDNDKDGFTNIDEFNYQSNPTKADTDDDGISDGDEVNVYGIDPTKNDSTNSQIQDFVKLKVCNDPAFRFTNLSNKLSEDRKKALNQNITKFKLHEPTITSLKKVGATDADLANGYLAVSCSSINIKS
jgi:hypothetical protein